MAPWPPASARSRGRGPGDGPPGRAGPGGAAAPEGEERDGALQEAGGVTHRVQGPGAEGSDASREGLGEST